MSRIPASFASTSFQSTNGRSSRVSTTTSALVDRILVLRSFSNPDITDSAMIGAAVPRNTPNTESAVKTVKIANSTPRRTTTPPSPIAMCPPMSR